MDLKHSTCHNSTFFCICWQGIKSVSININFPQSHLWTLIIVCVFSLNCPFPYFGHLEKWGRVLPRALFAQLSLSCFIWVPGITLVTSTVLLQSPTTERNTINISGFHQTHIKPWICICGSRVTDKVLFCVVWDSVLWKQVSLNEMWNTLKSVFPASWDH